MQTTEVAAWVGAITGSVAVPWDFFKWMHTGPRIAVSAAPNMVGYGSAAVLTGDKDMVVVEAVNVGDGKTTVTHLVGYHYDSFWKRALRRKPTKQIVVPDPSPGVLPHVLDRGERWVGMIEQDEALATMSTKGYLYVGVLHSTARAPALTRLIIRKAAEG